MPDYSILDEETGNKIRKLEFLLADALKKGCDSVVTIGGEQSNHARATASAARMVGMEPHLILRTKRAQAMLEEKEEFGLTGNILFDRIVGSKCFFPMPCNAMPNLMDDAVESTQPVNATFHSIF